MTHPSFVKVSFTKLLIAPTQMDKFHSAWQSVTLDPTADDVSELSNVSSPSGARLGLQ